jgi:acetyl esterase/lipase
MLSRRRAALPFPTRSWTISAAASEPAKLNSSRLLVGLGLLAAAIVPWPTVAAEPPPAAPPGKPCVYKSVGGEAVKLEIFFPPNHDPARSRSPGLLLFHGGGWSRGTLEQFRIACAYFASRGFVAATANYRMHQKQDVPTLPAGESFKRLCVTDAKSAIRWMKQHAAELGLDPQRLVTGGGSAGGHIAVLASANPRGLNDPSDPPGFDTTVVAHVLFNPAFAPKDADPEINVLSHLAPDFPPSVVFFGSEDRWKPAWDETQRKLKALGHAAGTQWVAPGETHGFYLKPPWEAATLIAADRFFVKLGLLQGEPTLQSGTTLRLDTGAAPAAK